MYPKELETQLSQSFLRFSRQSALVHKRTNLGTIRTFTAFNCHKNLEIQKLTYQWNDDVCIVGM